VRIDEHDPVAIERKSVTTPDQPTGRFISSDLISSIGAAPLRKPILPRSGRRRKQAAHGGAGGPALKRPFESPSSHSAGIA